MHKKVLEVIAIDCVAYSEHNAPSSILDNWSKEQMAFAITELCKNIRVIRAAVVSSLPPLYSSI
jgi:hypothetical protein